jgi:asparagine synthase (glutamine-hydrolysing)
MLKNVRKLPPGSAMIVRSGGIVREWTHYDQPYGRAPLAGTERDLAHELRERVQEAVDRQMISDVPVGAFLSGGLDSSAVVAMMKKARPDYRPRCYTIGFRGEAAEEGAPADLPYARRVAEHLDVDLCEIIVESSAIENLERMLWHLDEPQADPAPINAMLIAERARAENIPVLLSGAGGDDIFSGYRRHQALMLERTWGWLPQAMRAGIAGPARWLAWNGSLPSVMKWHPARRAAKAFVYADMARDERLVSYFWWSGEAMRRALYTRDLGGRLEDVDTAAPLLDSLARIPKERDPLNRMLYLETRHFLADHNLNYTDKMGMASGIEVRVPLLDPDLVDFATRVPSAFKQRGRVGKSIFKRAMEADLPHDVIYRPKTGFGAPLRRWLQAELRDRVEDTLSSTALRNRGLFDPVAVRRLIQQDREGRVDGGYTIFSLMCIELWCRMFVDAPAVSADLPLDESDSAVLGSIPRTAS